MLIFVNEIKPLCILIYLAFQISLICSIYGLNDIRKKKSHSMFSCGNMDALVVVKNNL